MSQGASTTRRRLSLLRDLAAGQAIIQVLTMLAGFVVLRTMPVSEFALYSLAFGFTSVIGLCVDAGFTRSIIALVGDRIDDSELIARYVAVARSKRRVVAVFVGPCAAALFMVLTHDRGWSLETRTALVAIILASVWLQGSLALYATPLLIRSDLRRFYATQAAGSAGRLAGFGTAATLGVLTPTSALGMNVAYFGYLKRRLRLQSLRHVPDWREADPALSASMNAYLRPLWPSIVFFAGQSQIIILVVATIATATTVGEVAALSRIATLFAILWTLNPVLVEPFLARTPRDLLVRRYLSVLALSAGGSAALTVAAALEPRPLLWLLGEQYDHLGSEVALAVLAALLTYVGIVIWTMNTARRWIFAWQTTLYIGLTVLTQVGCLLMLDVTTTRGAMLFGVWSSAALLVSHAVGGYYGLRRRQSLGESATP